MVVHLFTAIFIVVLFLLIANRKKPTTKLRHPPGPRGLPFIGNLHQYDYSNLYESLAKLASKYGPLMYMKLAQKPAIVISSAKIAEEVFKNNDLAFSGRYISTATRAFSYNCVDITFSPYSEYWAGLRKMVVLNLFTKKQVNSFRSIRMDEVSSMIKEIYEQANSNKLVNINEVALSFAKTVICRVAFGKRFDEGQFGKRRYDKLPKDLQALTMMVFLGDHFPLLSWVDKVCGKISRLEKIVKGMDSFYQELIDEHVSPNRPLSMDGDLLDLLIQLREEQLSSSTQFDWDHIKAILQDIFVGGTDTSAASITWAMTALIKNPNVLKKAQEEIRSVIGKKDRVGEDDLLKLPYFKAIMKETLRLHPPAPLSVPRETIQACTVHGYDIESKTVVFFNIWAIGRDPEFWENPDEFIPERFLNSTIDYKGQDYGLLPFGSGRRICPGMSLAIAGVEIALANLLYSFDWELPNGIREDDVDTEGTPGFSVQKKNALRLKAKPNA